MDVETGSFDINLVELYGNDPEYKFLKLKELFGNTAGRRYKHPRTTSLIFKDDVKLKLETSVVEWCKETGMAVPFLVEIYPTKIIMKFETETDLLHFRLRWL